MDASSTGMRRELSINNFQPTNKRVRNAQLSPDDHAQVSNETPTVSSTVPPIIEEVQAPAKSFALADRCNIFTNKYNNFITMLIPSIRYIISSVYSQIIYFFIGDEQYLSSDEEDVFADAIQQESLGMFRL